MRKHRTKRLLAALLSALLLLSMTACGSHSSTGSQPDKNSPTAQQADNQKQAANKQDEANYNKRPAVIAEADKPRCYVGRLASHQQTLGQ